MNAKKEFQLPFDAAKSPKTAALVYMQQKQRDAMPQGTSQAQLIKQAERQVIDILKHAAGMEDIANDLLRNAPCAPTCRAVAAAAVVKPGVQLKCDCYKAEALRRLMK